MRMHRLSGKTQLNLGAITETMGAASILPLMLALEMGITSAMVAVDPWSVAQ